jgi:hypothetical protein
MLLRHVHLTTRLRSSLSSYHLFAASRAHVKVCRITISSLTRPCAKARAARLESAITWNGPLQSRGAKRKASVNIDDVPQGAIGIDALPPQDDAEPDYPPLLQQVRNTMLRFSHCVLVTRVGGFYEVRLRSINSGDRLTAGQLYFEQADEYAPLLNLKKAKRKASKGSKKTAVSMVSLLRSYSRS